MNKIIVTLLLAFCYINTWAVDEPFLIPAPQKINVLEGKTTLSDNLLIYHSDGLASEAYFLKEYLRNEFKISAGSTQNKNDADILLMLDKSNTQWKENEYRLTIQSGIKIEANNSTGVFYGMQTLYQLIEAKDNTFTVPNVEITDYPAFKWRAFMLDEARVFKGKEVVKDLLDAMARLKMNIFHWHLTDDQGWRIEIKKYPKLTEVGAYRDSTQLGGYKSKIYDGKPHGGYYTQDDIREIIEYARQRHIEIIPEIEMPGHATAAIAAYPWLGTTGESVKVACLFGVQYEVFNVADPRVITFFDDVLDEVIALFPSKIIHIGGDEVKYEQWKNSNQIQAYMKSLDLKTPADLQIYFTNRMSNSLKQKGRQMMGWNDIVGMKLHHYQSQEDGQTEQKLAEGTIVHFWKGDIDMITEVTKKGYDIVNSFHEYTYLDYDYTQISLEDAYHFSPIPENLPAEYHHKVLGMGCQMWGELIIANATMYQFIFPRLMAYAEGSWTLPERKDYKRFQRALYFKKEQLVGNAVRFLGN